MRGKMSKLESMPFSIQIVAPRFEDEQLLNFAMVLDKRFRNTLQLGE